MRSLAFLAVGLHLALAGAAQAQPDGLGYFVGRWAVESKDPAGGDVLKVDYSIEAARGGAWLAGSSLSTDGAVSARDMWGRDPLTGELIRVIFDGAGVFATVRSAGWAGDRLVLEGEARSRGGVLRVRETITRRDDRRFDVVWEAFRNGAWSPYALETATRV